MNLNIGLYLIIYIIIINIISFYVMKSDKTKAKRGQRRISERSIFTFALFLGATGVYAGMYKFRHKTKHFKFVIFVPVLIILNILSVYYIITLLY